MKRSIQFLMAITALVSFAFVSPHADLRPITVVIDAGHGGDDFGAKYGGYLEKDITAKIAARIKEMNQNSNVILQFTRDGDESKDLISRTAFINKTEPDLVISLHVHSSPLAEASGIELYSSKESASAMRSAQLAEALKTTFEKSKYRVNIPKTGPFHILKNSKAPAIIVELGNLENERDRNYLTDEAHQKRIAATILQFIGEL